MRTAISLALIMFIAPAVMAHVKDVKVEEYGSAVKITYTETEDKLEHVEYIRKADIVTVLLSGRDLNHPFIRIVRKGHYPENVLGTEYQFDRDQWEEAEKLMRQIVSIVFAGAEKAAR